MEIAIVVLILAAAVGHLIWLALRRRRPAPGAAPSCGGCVGCAAPPPEGCCGPTSGQDHLVTFDSEPRR